MPYLVLGIALVISLFLVIRGLRGANPQAVLRILKWAGLSVGLMIFVILTLRGGLATLLALIPALIPLFLMRRSLGRMARNWRGPEPGQTSDVETRFLRMTLDHDTGSLTGTVLEGKFKGRLLQELDGQQVLELLHECRVNDEQAARILETYLDRIYGPDWRGDGADGDAGARPGAGAGGMTRAEAYEILELRPGATPEQIKEAHRRLMIKMHPDRGGSTYLAAKINQAKDLLLGE